MILTDFNLSNIFNAGLVIVTEDFTPCTAGTDDGWQNITLEPKIEATERNRFKMWINKSPRYDISHDTLLQF